MHNLVFVPLTQEFSNNQPRIVLVSNLLQENGVDFVRTSTIALAFAINLQENERTSKQQGDIGRELIMAKAQHKWSSDLKDIEFSFSDRGSQGKVFWQKRKELLLKAGAKLTQEPQLNKDGSLNISAKFAKVLRADHEDKISDAVTTEDIVFPSPNELGIFLRYGGDNTWTSLIDKDGKSLDDWSRAE